MEITRNSPFKSYLRYLSITPARKSGGNSRAGAANQVDAQGRCAGGHAAGLHSAASESGWQELQMKKDPLLAPRPQHGRGQPRRASARADRAHRHRRVGRGERAESGRDGVGFGMIGPFPSATDALDGQRSPSLPLMAAATQATFDASPPPPLARHGPHQPPVPPATLDTYCRA
ncbi:hypothetical protein ABZP36_027457 [Zizania latifolia]